MSETYGQTNKTWTIPRFLLVITTALCAIGICMFLVRACYMEKTSASPVERITRKIQNLGDLHERITKKIGDLKDTQDQYDTEIRELKNEILNERKKTNLDQREAKLRDSVVVYSLSLLQRNYAYFDKLGEVIFTFEKADAEVVYKKRLAEADLPIVSALPEEELEGFESELNETYDAYDFSEEELVINIQDMDLRSPEDILKEILREDEEKTRRALEVKKRMMKEKETFPDQETQVRPPEQEPVRLSGNIGAPRKIRDVKPVYPAYAKQSRIQGTVRLEILINPHGSVIDVKVIRSIPMLDSAAINAVKQWKYQNVLAVPIKMTVDVNFYLESQSASQPEQKKRIVVKPSPKPRKPVSRFVDNNNGTVTDTQTRLMWSQKDNGSDIDWQKAVSYCQTIELAGHEDWRLPNIEELRTLYSNKVHNCGGLECNVSTEFSLSSRTQWSSTIYHRRPLGRRKLLFRDAFILNFGQSRFKKNSMPASWPRGRVLCIRDR